MDISSTQTLVTTIQNYTKHEKLRKPESAAWDQLSLTSAISKNVASLRVNKWHGKYNKAWEYPLIQICGPETEKNESLEAFVKYVVERAAHKVSER